ncbi:MAG: hypothetical protein E7554_09135 [Ruminococcaceae bacterium]|nr:hypothetical protein [Oscillospiraceae bacterium]
MSPFVQGEPLLSLLGMSKRYGQRPSLLLGVEDPYAAWCLDEACMYIMCRIENDGRLPRPLQRLSEPRGNSAAVLGMINTKGVEHHDYRRNSGGISDAVH